MLDEIFVDLMRSKIGSKMEGIHFTRMFRNYGLYQRGHFFGIIADEKLYFRTDRISRQKYIRLGMRRYHSTDRAMKRFYQVPQSVIEDPNTNLLLAWAYESAAVRDQVPQQSNEYR